MVEVFKTNINDGATAHELATQLATLYPLVSVNFDLDDCDRILRLKGESINTTGVLRFMQSRGHVCEVLE